MKQTYHSNSSTNVRLRSEINKSNSTNLDLSLRYGISENTVSKWKNSVILTDKSSRPNTIHYALSELEMLIAVELRTLTWWALDELTEIINPENPESIRSAVYRTFVREGVNKVPDKQKDKASKFKEYDPGYLILTLLIYQK